MTLEHPLSDSWKTRPLGFFEWCWCGCALTGGDITRYSLDPNVKHTDAMVHAARTRYLQTVAPPLKIPSPINWSIGGDDWKMT